MLNHYDMPGITNLDMLLSSMEPELQNENYIFCTFPGSDIAGKLHLKPILCFHEKEGLTLIIEKEMADKNNIEYLSAFKLISLTIHSSLDAVGLTAAISQKLADKGISANVVAAYFHDHIFVPEEKAHLAIESLHELQQESLRKVNA